MKSDEIHRGIMCGAILSSGILIAWATKTKDSTTKVTIDSPTAREMRLEGEFSKILIHQQNGVKTLVAGEGDYAKYETFFAVKHADGLRIHLVQKGQGRNADTDMLIPNESVELIK